METFVDRAPSKLKPSELNLLDEHRDYLSAEELERYFGKPTPPKVEEAPKAPAPKKRKAK